MENAGSSTDVAIVERITDFIVENFLFGDVSRKPGRDDSLIENGIVDSTGILEMIEFLEAEFGIEVKEEETVPANLDSLAALDRFVRTKQKG